MFKHHLSHWLKLPTIFILLVLLSACGGGGGDGGGVTIVDPTGDQGSVDPTTGLITPTVVNTPYRGSVTAGGVSYYVAKGLTASTKFTLYTHSLTDAVSLSGYSTSLFFGSSCSSSRSGTLSEACSMTSTADGDIFIKIDGASATGNTNFTIEILDAAVSQGTLAAPLEIAASSLPYRGSVAESQDSYYLITGLTRAQIYSISLTNIINNPNLNAYPSKNFTGAALVQRCYSTNPSWEDESCDLGANFEGRLYIKVTGGSSFPSYGSYFNLTVSGTSLSDGYIFEGYDDAPIILASSSLPYRGEAYDYDSHYRVTGLTAATRYEIHFTNYTTTTDIVVYSDATDPGGTTCTRFSFYADKVDNFCVVTTTNAGNINVRVRAATQVEGGTRFDISTKLAPVDEGTALSPKTITMAYNGQVGTGSSYYVIAGLTPNWTYEISGSNFTRNITVFSGVDFNTMTQNTGRSDTAGNLFVKVFASGSDGAWFTLNQLTANNPEGTKVLPVDISAATQTTPYSGQVDDRISYYSSAGLTPDKYYMVHINNVDNTRPDVTAFLDSAYSIQGCIDDFISVTEEGHCLTKAGAGGEIFIRVDGADNITGSQYKLWVDPSLIISEGSAAAPLDIDPGGNLNLATPLGVSYAATVSSHFGDASSFYKVTLTSGPADYTVSLTGMTDNVDLRVTNAATSWTSWCTSNNWNLQDESCVVTSDIVGGGVKSVDLIIEVTTSTATYTKWDGGNFLLTVTPGGTPRAVEGTSVSPIDITGIMPYVGQVTLISTEYSYYKVTALAPNAKHEVRINTDRDLLNMKVYSDASYPFPPLCDVWFSTPPPPQSIDCQATASATGELYIVTNGSQINGSEANYEIEVVVAPSGEGTQGVPVDITGTVPRASQVGGILDASGLYVDGTVNSYYAMTGLVAGDYYQIKMTDVTGYFQYQVYDDAGFSVLSNCNPIWASSTCNVAANANGELYIFVDGFGTSSESGSYFTLNVYPQPIGEGSIAAPINLTRQVVYSGRHGGITASIVFDAGYYQISGLTPFASYRTTIQNMSDSTEIAVFGEANYLYSLCETTDTTNTLGCSAAANASGMLYIRVQGPRAATVDIIVP